MTVTLTEIQNIIEREIVKGGNAHEIAVRINDRVSDTYGRMTDGFLNTPNLSNIEAEVKRLVHERL